MCSYCLLTAEQLSGGGKPKWTSQLRSVTSRGRGGGNKRTICLWQFLRELLLNQSHHNWIRWVDRTKGQSQTRLIINYLYCILTHSIADLFPRSASLTPSEPPVIAYIMKDIYNRQHIAVIFKIDFRFRRQLLVK